ncbi:hypothetical protein V6N13_141966 [Hibiscus sabdariffa]
MEPLLGFEEETIEAYNQEFSPSTPSNDYKLVPWLNCVEWESVRKSLFSSSQRKISFALSRKIFSRTWNISDVNDASGSKDVRLDETSVVTYCLANMEIRLMDEFAEKNVTDSDGEGIEDTMRLD